MGVLRKKSTLQGGYDHQAWEGRRRFLRFLLKTIGFTLLVRLDHVVGVENIPRQGAVIFMINHIAFVDPFVVMHVAPRNIVPMAKVEAYDYPLVGIFPRMWGVIPVHRGEVDRAAIRQALAVLRAGESILVAPEGTRGVALQQGREGVAYLGARTGAAIVPVALEGTVGFPSLRPSKRWRQPGVRVRFGQPFRYREAYRSARGEALRRMTDEAMYVLAALLPEERRGVYADLSRATQETIEWLK